MDVLIPCKALEGLCNLMDGRRLLTLCGETNRKLAAALAGLVGSSLGLAQQPCVRIDGTITDPSRAVIAGAQVQSADGERTAFDTTDRLVLSCVPAGSTTITVTAEGFAQSTAMTWHARCFVLVRS
jgi:hypothetical protein